MTTPGRNKYLGRSRSSYRGRGRGYRGYGGYRRGRGSTRFI